MIVLWVMSAIGLLLVAPLVITLATRVIRPALECARYADDILVHGVGITAALDPVPVLVETREAVGEVGAQAGAYVEALRRVVSSASPGTTP